MNNYDLDVPVILNIKINSQPAPECENEFIMMELPSQVKISFLISNNFYQQIILLNTIFKAKVVFVFN